MQRRIRRMALMISCGLALGAFAAASAQAAIQSTTGAAKSIKETSAVLHGQVSTGGAATVWQFEYGKTKRFGKFTAIHVINKGHGTVAVSAKITNLTPGTTYHFRLLSATGNNTIYYPLMSSEGRSRQFTTARGKLTLDSSKLSVTKGSVSVGLKCESSQTCNGAFSITKRIRVNKGFKTLTCAQTSFTINAGKSKKFSLSVSSECLTLLNQAANHTLDGTMTATLKGRQRGFSKSVTLKLK